MTTDTILPGTTALSPSRLLWQRLGVGVVQSVLLYALHRAKVDTVWFDDRSGLYMALLPIMCLVPLQWVSALGTLSWRQWLSGLSLCSIAVAGLGAFAAWRQLEASPVEAFGIVPALFIVQAMMLAGSREGRVFASYPGYFGIAWKLVMQLVLSLAFLVVLWSILLSGGMLFRLLHISRIMDWLRMPGFYIPVCCLGLVVALHVTDVREGLTHGIRQLVLTLLSWLLPVAGGIVSAFLVTTLFTGLQPLWETGYASPMLLGTAALLVLMINAVYQDGESGKPPAVLQWGMRGASLLLLPLVAVAAYSQGVRVGEYGWTPDRVLAAAATLLAGCYALGYSWAVFDTPRRLANTNVVAAYLTVALSLGLLTPLADPARISVNSQLARLENHAVTRDEFDFDFLLRSGRYGQQGLERIARNAGKVFPEKAVHEAQSWLEVGRGKRRTWPEATPSRADIRKVLTLLGQGELPPRFIEKDWRLEQVPPCIKDASERCEAVLLADAGQARQLVLFTESMSPTLYGEQADGNWRFDGYLFIPSACREQVKQALAARHFQSIEPLHRDLAVDGQRITMDPPPGRAQFSCKESRKN